MVELKLFEWELTPQGDILCAECHEPPKVCGYAHTASHIEIDFQEGKVKTVVDGTRDEFARDVYCEACNSLVKWTAVELAIWKEVVHRGGEGR